MELVNTLFASLVGTDPFTGVDITIANCKSAYWDEGIVQQLINQALDEGEKLCYENLSDARTLELKTPTVTVKVKTNETGTPEVRKIDGRNCIVIPVEGELTVNGMKVETAKIR